jgi:DNA ligase 1
VLSAELTVSPNHTAGWGQVKEDAGLSMRFPRFTRCWRDDEEPQDTTATQQLVELYRTGPPGTRRSVTRLLPSATRR